MKHTFLVFAVIALAACSGQTAQDDSVDNHTAHQMDKGIVISSATIRPPLPGRDIAAGYMSVTNHTKTDDKLLSATSPISGRIELHTHLNENGVMKMRQVDGIEIKAGETVELKPGGLHLMMFDVNLPADQQDVSVTLNYEKAPSMTMIIPLTDKSKGQGSAH